MLAQVGKLAQGYRQAQAERAQLEAKLKGPPLQLMSFVSQTGQKLGMQLLDDDMFRLWKEGIVEKRYILAKANAPDELANKFARACSSNASCFAAIGVGLLAFQSTGPVLPVLPPD